MKFKSVELVAAFEKAIESFKTEGSLESGRIKVLDEDLDPILQLDRVEYQHDFIRYTLDDFASAYYPNLSKHLQAFLKEFCFERTQPNQYELVEEL